MVTTIAATPGATPRDRIAPAPAALLWAAGVLVVVLMLLSLLPCIRFFPILITVGEPGFSWQWDARDRTMTVEAIARRSAAEAAGLRPGDVILRIQGREPSPALDLWGTPRHPILQPGDGLAVTVLRGRRLHDLRWQLEEVPWTRVRFAAGGWRLGMDQVFHALYLLTAVATWCLGAWVLWQKPHLLQARALAGLSWALCLAMWSAVVAHAPEETVHPLLYRLTYANDGWSRLALAAGVYFFLVFPEPKKIMRRHAWPVALALFLPATALLVAHGALGHSLWRFQFLEGRPRLHTAIELLEAIDWWGYSCPALLLAFGLLLHSYRTAQRGPARRQMRTLGLAAAPLTLYAFVTTLLYLTTGRVPIEIAMFGPPVFLTWPLALGYAILTQGAFDINRAMRRGVAYALSTLAVAALCFLLAALIGQRAIARLGSAYTGLVIAALALLAHPVWGGVQRWVDRRFGRDRIATLYRLESLSSEIATTLEREPLIQALTQRVAILLGAPVAALFCCEGDGAAPRAADVAIRLLRATGAVATGEALDDLAATIIPRLPPDQPTTLYTPADDARRIGMTVAEVERVARSGLVLWMRLGQRGEGELVLALGWKKGEDVYSHEELAFLRVLGSQAAAAWENMRLLAERESRARVEQEIAIGRAIQMQLLPPTPLIFGEFRIDARCVPATEVGGDFYNIFPLPSRGAAIGIAFGDVAGKGVPGALSMAVVSAMLEGLAQASATETSPGALLARANDRVHPKLRPLRMFATTLCAVLDPDTGTLALANAGQTPPILWREGSEPEFLRMAGLPLGARSQATYEERCLTLQPGDLCIFTSDGLLDAANPRAYTELRDRLQSEARRSPEALLDALYDLSADVEADDRTVLVLSWNVWSLPDAPSDAD